MSQRPASGRDKYLQEFAAITIQRYWRGARERHAYNAKKSSARRIERVWLRERMQVDVWDLSARRIQNAWRSFRNRRIYYYYRDLIQFRERGEPKELLRSINPREAQLADAAAGVHVRFRLGGSTFPPFVFYRIFTHRPITDIGAFGPRDYHNEAKGIVAGEVHNHPKRAAQQLEQLRLLQLQKQQDQQRRQEQKQAGTMAKKNFEDDFEIDDSLREYIRPDGTRGVRSTKGWYARQENNGWRPVAERVLVDEDPVTATTRLKRLPLFHYDPAVRRQTRVQKMKNRKRDWMLRMYGILGTPPDTASSSDLGSSELGGYGDPGADVNDLIEWTQHLDFDAYLDDWTSMACTLGSEAFVPEDERLFLSELPAPGGDVSGAMAAAGAPLQPHKGVY